MTLTSDQIAAAEAAGCRFLPASPAQASRLAMQRKVFQVNGQPMLATRGGGLYETAATLERLIALGQDMLRPTLPEAAPPAQDAGREDPALEPPRRRATEPAPRRRPRPAPAPRAEAWTAPPDPPAQPEPSPKATTARPGRAPRGGERWVTAGAERRGRAGVHWSTRQQR